MTTSVLLLLIGFLLLIFGANALVTGASALARKLGVTDLVLGLTVVAFGTSIPELTVNTFNATNGLNEAVFGNVIGSNIFNLLFILGVAALIYPIKVNRRSLVKELPFSIIITGLLWLLVHDHFFRRDLQILNRSDALILLVLFGIYLVSMFRTKDEISPHAVPQIKPKALKTSIIMILFGLVGLIFGGYLTTTHAVKLAFGLGMSERMVGLTILAIGTSLPELVTSGVAAYRKNAGIALGNVIGSNIFNIIFILASSALIKPIAYDPLLNRDLFTLIVANFLLIIFFLIGKKMLLNRWKAAVFIIVYIGYMVMVIQMG